MARLEPQLKPHKIVIELPQGVVDWCRQRAFEWYQTEEEYLRIAIIKMCVQDQRGIRGDMPVDASMNFVEPLTPSAPTPLAPPPVETDSELVLQPAATVSGYRGVYPYGKKWAAFAVVDGIRQRVGTASTPKEAASIYARFIQQQANDAQPLDQTAESGNGATENVDGFKKGPRNTASGYVGVYACKEGWEVKITHRGKLKRVGVCESVEEAARTYDVHLIAQGKPAVNFPEHAASDASADPFIQTISVGTQMSPAQFAAMAHATDKPILKSVDARPLDPATIRPVHTQLYAPDDAPLTDAVPVQRLRFAEEEPSPEMFVVEEPDPDLGVFSGVDADPDPLDPATVTTDGQVHFPLKSDPDNQN